MILYPKLLPLNVAHLFLEDFNILNVNSHHNTIYDITCPKMWYTSWGGGGGGMYMYNIPGMIIY